MEKPDVARLKKAYWPFCEMEVRMGAGGLNTPRPFLCGGGGAPLLGAYLRHPPWRSIGTRVYSVRPLATCDKFQHLKSSPMPALHQSCELAHVLFFPPINLGRWRLPR
jgi:hypothetical protein